MMFVLLEHDLGGAPTQASDSSDRGVHWDFMVEIAGQEHLATWRLTRNPLQAGGAVSAERIDAHRRAYLDYEGEISGGRGRVRRLDRGEVTVTQYGGDTLGAELKGRYLRGRIEIASRSDGLVFRWMGGSIVASLIYDEFLQRVKELHRARAIGALLEWDQDTYMPRRGAEERAQQNALIAGLAHEKLTSDEVGRRIEQLEATGDRSDPVVVTNVREMRREYDRAVKIPRALVEEIARTTSLAREAWVQARQDSNFAYFAPHLAKLLDLKRQVADCVGWDTEPYDALMDEFEPGAKAAGVQAVFDRLKPELVALAAAIKEAPRQPDVSILERACPQERQVAFNRRVAEAMGFDFEAGRIDTTVHPFCAGICPLDVRLTTRYDEHYLPMSLFGIMHEAGHGLYEQGLDPQHCATPMGKYVSLGIHESQSRMWENLVGRSRPFWEHFYPLLQAEFPSFADVPLNPWCFAINAVRPSFIRVEADEVTYGLHIMLRFDLERDMIAGRLNVKDVPEVWNTRFRAYLGLTPPNDAEGCLQDIHWSMGIFGYFPTYQLGNLYAAQFFNAARAALPDLDAQLRRGELRPLREWLRENIHRHGMRYPARELLTHVTGHELSHQPYLEYLRGKFRPLYGL